MKKLLLLLLFLPCIAFGQSLELPGMSQNRYPEDEAGEDGRYRMVLVSDGTTPVNGVVYSEYENGQLEWEEDYKDGHLHGLQRRWHKNGQLESEANWKNQMPDGLWRGWDENGQLTFEGNYKNARLDGLRRRWHENGQLAAQGNWKNDNPDGVHRAWHENGQLKSECIVIIKEKGNYKDSEVIGAMVWEEEPVAEEAKEGEPVAEEAMEEEFVAKEAKEAEPEPEEGPAFSCKTWDKDGNLITDETY